MNTSLYPSSEPHEVGHVAIKGSDSQSNSMFPIYHASGAIPETECPIDETVETMITTKEKIIYNMSKYSDSSSDNLSQSESNEGNPESGVSTEYYSMYSSKYSDQSNFGHIPVKPLLPHHHVHNPLRAHIPTQKDNEDSENESEIDDLELTVNL